MKQLFIIMFLCMITASCNKETNRELAITKNNEAVKLYGLNFKRHNVEKAIPLLEEAVKADPTYTRAYTNLAQCHCLLDNKEEAMEAMDKAVDIEKDNYRIYMLKGMLQMRYGLPEANETLEKALAMAEACTDEGKDSYAERAMYTSLMLSFLGREEEGRSHMEKMRPRYVEIAGNDDMAMKRYDLIMNGTKQVNPEQEIKSRWQILPIDIELRADKQMSQEVTELLKQFSSIVDAPEYAKNGVPEDTLRNKAMPLVEKMIAVSPKENYPRILLFACHVALKEYDKAMEITDNIGDSEDKRASLLYRGYLYDEMGQTAKADEMYRKSKACYDKLLRDSFDIHAFLTVASIIGMTEGEENMRTYLAECPQPDKVSAEHKASIRRHVDNLRLTGFDRKRHVHSIATESIKVKFNSDKVANDKAKQSEDMLAVVQDFANHSDLADGIEPLLKWHDDCEQKGYGKILDEILQVEQKKNPNTSTAGMEWHSTRDNGVALYKVLAAYKACLNSGNKDALKKELTDWGDFCAEFDRFILDAMQEKHEGGSIAIPLYQSEMQMVYAIKRGDFERLHKLMKGENVFTAKQMKYNFCNIVTSIAASYDNAELKKNSVSLKEKFNVWQTTRSQIAGEMPKLYALLFAEIEQQYAEIVKRLGEQ